MQSVTLINVGIIVIGVGLSIFMFAAPQRGDPEPPMGENYPFIEWVPRGVALTCVGILILVAGLAKRFLF